MKQKHSTKICKTCAFFYQHYIKSDDCFSPTFCGHCSNLALHHQIRKKSNPDYTCPLWTQAPDVTIARREHCRKILLDMANKIQNMAEVLQSDQTEE